MKAFTSHGLSYNYTEIYTCIYVFIYRVFYRYISVPVVSTSVAKQPLVSETYYLHDFRRNKMIKKSAYRYVSISTYCMLFIENV